MNNNSYAVFIVAHQDLAAALKETAEQIIGPQDILFTFSNKTDALPELENKINSKIRELNCDRNIIFVDMVGGSCWSLANLMKKKNESLTVIGGVNLPMLLSFFMNYQNMDYEELLDKITADGSRGIVLIKGMM